MHRRDELRAEKILQDRLLRHDRIDVLWHQVVEEVKGGDGPMDGVEAVTLRHTQTGERRSLPVTGLFVAIGHDPATAPFQGVMASDDEGYLLAEPNSTRTSIAGVFAAGDCVDKIYRQAVTAAGMGCMAALQAEKFLAEQEDAAAAAAE